MQIELETLYPIVLEKLQKRLRSTKFIILRKQLLEQDIKKLQVEKSLKRNVRELLIEKTNKQRRATCTLYIKYNRKSFKRDLLKIQITTKQTN